MFYVVENSDQIARLTELVKSSCFLHIIRTNDNYHPKVSRVVAVYFRPLCDKKGYIVPVNHNEGISVSLEQIQHIIDSSTRVYVLNKKEALYYFKLGKKVIDVNLKYSMTHFKKLSVISKESTCVWYYGRHCGRSYVNQAIPLSKLYERCEDYYKQVEKLLSEPLPKGFDFYNEYATKVYFMVEQSGLRVDLHAFNEHFHPTDMEYFRDRETIYTSYNLYNCTSRPTNSFNSVNFLAIPKKEEFRNLFKPQGDRFIELDYDGFHIRLVANILGYPLNTEEKAHKQLARLYNDVSFLTPESYAELKASNFQMIYGTPSEGCRDLEISKQIQSLIKSLWNIFEKQGHVVNPDSKRLFTTELEDMYPQKLFNYLIQSLETSKNVKTLYKVLKYLEDSKCKSKICLVTYDSYLLDWYKEDGEKTIQDIRDIMEKGDNDKKQFPVEIKSSKNLCF